MIIRQRWPSNEHFPLLKQSIMKDNQSPQSAQPQRINLDQVAKNFFTGLQRQFDLLAFNLAAQETVQESIYQKYTGASQILPSFQYRQNFEQLQAHARDLLVRQIINDSLNMSLAAINNCHFFLSLIRATDANKKILPEAQKEAQTSQQNFIRANWDEKFNRLEKDYGIMCELEDSIISLGLALQILVKQNKVVHKAQLDNRSRLLLELKSTEADPEQKPAVGQLSKLKNVRKTYREGDIITFDDDELQMILITIASFADSLFKSVVGYARSVQEKM